jgi:pimeloyl-ACP methyl ester carboxylesterase
VKIRPLSYWLKLTSLTLLAVVVSIILVSAVGMALVVTVPLKSSICCDTPARFGADYESVQFTTADGLTLRGWYVPPQNRAVIILTHSYYSDRRAVLPVAEMLYKHGYGLLMYDQRASGESDGTIRSLGWLDIADVPEAASLVTAHRNGSKIGAFGCSIGGAIAIAGAVKTPSITAVAADAPSPLNWSEMKPRFTLQDPFSPLIVTLYYPLVILRTGTFPPTSTAEAIQAYAPRPILFISTGQAGEKDRIQHFYDIASQPKTLINIPSSSHCAAPLTNPEEYERYLVEFFDAALLDK